MSNSLRVNSVALGALVLAVLAAGPALAQGGVVTPDSPRYVEKMTEEQLAVAMAGSQAEKAALCLGFAQERIREMRALAKRRQYRHHEALAHAWRVLTVEGAMEAARQGSLARRDMRKTYAAMVPAMERFRKQLETHGAEGLGEKARAAVQAAAGQARQAGEKARIAMARERERVEQHEAMLSQARVRLKTQLRQQGRTDDEAEALAAQVMARCRYHARVRVRLMAGLLEGVKEGTALQERAEVAARADSLCDAGFPEEGAAIMTRALLSGPGPHRERVRVMREAEGLCLKCKESDRAGLARELGALTRTAQEKGLAVRALVQVMRQIRRAQRQGVPARVMADYVKTELSKLGNLGELGASVEKSDKALKKLRSAMKKKAAQYRDRMRKAAENAAGKGAAGKGKGN